MPNGLAPALFAPRPGDLKIKRDSRVGSPLSTAEKRFRRVDADGLSFADELARRRLIIALLYTALRDDFAGAISVIEPLTSAAPLNVPPRLYHSEIYRLGLGALKASTRQSATSHCRSAACHDDGSRNYLTIYLSFCFSCRCRL